MTHILRFLFYAAVVRPLVYVVLGLNVRRRELLPEHGPAVVCGNHNSHLDAMVLISLFPLSRLRNVRPVAAADYFLRSPLLAWISLNLIGIIPLDRGARQRGEDPLLSSKAALERGEILVLFPEGSRGAPEERSELRKGVAHLIESHPATPTVPVFMHGLGKSLPKGEGLLVPFFCDVFVGDAIHWDGDRASYMRELDSAMNALEDEGDFAEWD